MKIGITIGDINGIGPEVILKSLRNEKILKHMTPVIYGSSKALSYHKNTLDDFNMSFHHINNISKLSNGKINILNCWEETVDINLGKVDAKSGKFAAIALERAVQDLKNKNIDGLVTAPINKAAMKASNFEYPGHTEYLSAKFGGSSLMMMVNDDLRIALATNHLPIKEVAGKITKDLISKKIDILNKSLMTDFGIDKPTIAVMGLNPHAGDEGAIGQEEEQIIRPAIIEAKKKGLLVFGPYAADGFFGSSNFKKFDAILAMFHDQGLIPFKALSFGAGTNFTAGLPVIRTSPDHGTAFDIAGQNQADYKAMQKAIYTAYDIIKMRDDYYDARKNALDKKVRPMDNEEDDEIIEDVD
jgi:4-hydroxythreonine-4-phosphate dehydrogenase